MAHHLVRDLLNSREDARGGTITTEYRYGIKRRRHGRSLRDELRKHAEC